MLIHSVSVLTLRAAVERQAEPEFPEDGEDDERRDDRDELRLRDLLDDHVHVARERERERDERRDQYLRREAVEVLGLLALLDQPVVRGGRDEQHDGERIQPEAGEVYVLRQGRQLVEALGQHADELETEERLRARQHDAALGQHVLDLVGQLLLVVLTLALLLPHLALLLSLDVQFVGALAPPVEFEEVPEGRRQQRPEEPRRHARLPVEDLLRRHVEVDPQAQREGQQRPRHQPRRVAVYLVRVLAPLDQAVVGRRRDDERDGDEQQPEPRHLQQLRRQRQLVEPRLEDRAELEPDQHLRAQHEHPRLVERVLHLVFNLRHMSVGSRQPPRRRGRI